MKPGPGQRAEHERLAASTDDLAPWRLWGPYLSGRQWGTVREDYSANGDAWSFFPFDHAHRRAYRWGEDGIAGLCDRFGFLNLAPAFWNGHDDRLKERLFGLTNSQGNHGEDAKEFWWHLDATPTHSYAEYLYRYPQAAYPYQQLVEEGSRRRHLRPATRPETEMAWLAARRPDLTEPILQQHGGGTTLSVVTLDRLRQILSRMLDEAEFLSPHGIRALSAAYRSSLTVDVPGHGRLTIDYEPAESRDGLFRVGPDGRRPGDPVHLPTGPLWQAHPTFSEYFNGDTGAGLGASHQTGWTAMVADLICSGHPTDHTTRDASS